MLFILTRTRGLVKLTHSIPLPSLFLERRWPYYEDCSAAHIGDGRLSEERHDKVGHEVALTAYMSCHRRFGISRCTPCVLPVVAGIWPRSGSPAACRVESWSDNARNTKMCHDYQAQARKKTETGLGVLGGSEWMLISGRDRISSDGQA